MSAYIRTSRRGRSPVESDSHHGAELAGSHRHPAQDGEAFHPHWRDIDPRGPLTNGSRPHSGTPTPSSHRPRGSSRSPRDTAWARRSPRDTAWARRQWGHVTQGYSKFRTLYSSIAFGATFLFTLAKLNKVNDVLGQVRAECDHADVIIEQLSYTLSSRRLVQGLGSDHAGRKLLERLERLRHEIGRTVGEVRARMARYEAGEGDIGVWEKGRFYAGDSRIIEGLRGRLRGLLGEVKDLVVWLDRYGNVSGDRDGIDDVSSGSGITRSHGPRVRRLSEGATRGTVERLLA